MTGANMMASFGAGPSRREIVCLSVAIAAHSLLFLWQGGMLTLPGSGDNIPLGDPLLQVGYMSDVPEFSEPGAAGDEGNKRGIVGRVQQFFRGSDQAKPSRKPASDIAVGNAIDKKIEGTVAKWEKTDSTLVDKNFSDKKDFKGIQANQELAMVAGREADAIVEKRSVGTAVSASPNLKEKTFQVAKGDMPFQVASSNELDNLSNVNMVPVNTGKNTSPSITSWDAPGSAGVVGGSALKSKSMGSAATSSSKPGFSGSSRSAGSSAGGDLAMGGASVGGGMIDSGGIGSGYSGSGAGGGGSTPGGMGTGKGGGRGQGGGSPFGTSGAIGNKAGMLPRRQLVEDTSAVSNSSRSDVTITGELSRRPIREKFRPPYEIDARVALRFRVNSAGKVLDGIVVEISSGSPTFDNKVVAALKKWIFSALPLDKSNVIQEGVITFLFRGE